MVGDELVGVELDVHCTGSEVEKVDEFFDDDDEAEKDVDAIVEEFVIVVVDDEDEVDADADAILLRVEVSRLALMIETSGKRTLTSSSSP